MSGGGSNLSRAQREAAEAAARLERARDAGQQLSLIAPTEPEAAPPAAQGAPRKPGRPKGARNRAKTELRQLLAARGARMPEDVLAELAGLTRRGDPLALAMERAERLLAWAQDGARPTLGADGTKDTKPTTGQRLDLVVTILREMRAAGDALLPYGLAKVTPDQGGGAPVTFINLPAPVAQGAPGDGARVIEGEARTVAASVYAPPPMPSQPQRNQEVSSDEDEGSDE